jgi:hypothetical protein
MQGNAHGTHAGFNVERAQAPRRVEKERHVLCEEGFGGVAAVVLPCVHEHKILELDFQLSDCCSTLNPLPAASHPRPNNAQQSQQ